ncbi:hypothetical protein LEP1GSC194_4171 [Leptospira alstonii serovar Sichuan str. 79601]|uniref:Uncharacterized protein n=1 Tax=Leptospira alstonii serovar Sichuan str. 79601 TaxID=1218565 RepID=M6CJ18_9LEPT|nr:hypothetical protein LEP1GSC194_4171 [Leptospira alstonii serovar Sichuan str. 79601]
MDSSFHLFSAVKCGNSYEIKVLFVKCGNSYLNPISLRATFAPFAVKS